jgi:hypothetical protein
MRSVERESTMHTPRLDIRRLRDGSLDFVFYRRRAARLRARVLRWYVRKAVAWLRLLNPFVDARSTGVDERSRTLARVFPS